MPAFQIIKIVNPKNKDKFWIINEHDYDPKKHVLWEDQLETSVKKASPEDESDEIVVEIEDDLKTPEADSSFSIVDAPEEIEDVGTQFDKKVLKKSLKVSKKK